MVRTDYYFQHIYSFPTDMYAYYLYPFCVPSSTDIALYFVQRFPHLALAEDENGDSLLKWLADKPSNFLSGSNLGFSERWIYKCKYLSSVCILRAMIPKVWSSIMGG